MNSFNYKFITILGEADIGLYGLNCDAYTSHPWSDCKCRKQHTCVITGDIIRKGETCFRPLVNGYNRYHRISVAGMEWLKLLAKCPVLIQWDIQVEGVE
ncbi:hypothetical protein LCGC14_1543170 [marine sediment metagenome]|uniref:Uncharacterized protein n=1 Tax=marine sediment metagenome TaxID=412755 RepID=A0A0F9JDE4_9ZZZZ|nr:hypothetical protein [Phycisphaerales bacterium]